MRKKRKIFFDENFEPTSIFLLVIFVFLVINLFVVGNGLVLWDDDEAAYAGFALRMLENGDWINPQFTWSDVHRKTPFHFWSIALSYLIFGINEFAVRVPSSLAVLLTAIIILRLGSKIFGNKESKWAFIVFSGSFLCISMGKMSLTDAWLMFFETLSLFSLFLFLKEKKNKWNLLFWVSVSIGILVKGPPIIILTGGVWLGLLVFRKDKRQVLAVHPWFFGPISLIPFVLWAYLSFAKDGGELLTFLYNWYVVERIGGVVFGQTGPPGYHFIIAIIAFLPWIPFFIRGFWSVIRYPLKTESNLFLFLWILFAWGFYELMSSKLPSYAMAAHPAFALSTAFSLNHFFNSIEKKSSIIRNWEWIVVSILWFLFAWTPFIVFYILFPDNIAMVLISSLLISIFSIYLIFSRRIQKPLVSTFFGIVVLFLCWSFVASAFDKTPPRSSKEIVSGIVETVSKNNNYKNSKKIALCGFSNKQLRMSFAFYSELYFDEVIELKIDDLVKTVNNTNDMLFFLGEEAEHIAKTAIEQGKIKAWDLIKLQEWQSLNDQLKPHPFWLLYKIE